MKIEDSIPAALQILEMNPDWIYIYDLIEKRNIYENNKSLKFLGYSKEEFTAIQDNLLVNLIHPDDLLKIQNYHWRIQRSKTESHFTVEYRIKNKAGEYRIFSSNDAAYQRDAAGQIIQIIGTARDITRQRKLIHTLTNKKNNNGNSISRHDLMYSLEETNKIKQDELHLLQSSLEIIKRSRKLKAQADKLLGKTDEQVPEEG